MLVAGPAGGFEAGVGEFFAEDLERDAVLEGEGDGGGEGVHEAGDGGAFLGHADEDFSGGSVGVEADGDVAFVAGDGEFVGEGGALFGEAVADGAGRGLLVLLDQSSDLRGWLRRLGLMPRAALRRAVTALADLRASADFAWASASAETSCVLGLGNRTRGCSGVCDGVGRWTSFLGLCRRRRRR